MGRLKSAFHAGVQTATSCLNARIGSNNKEIKSKIRAFVISRKGYVNWPCDLISLAYFLWYYVKIQVYKSNTQSFPELKDEHISIMINKTVCKSRQNGCFIRLKKRTI